METMNNPMVSELWAEAAITKRLLERVSDDKLSWTPHPKSMSLGQLAFHVARLPGELSQMAQVDQFDASTANFNPPVPASREEILAVFEKGVAGAADYLGVLSPEMAEGCWQMVFHGN